MPHASSGGSASASGSSSDERAELEGGSMLDEDVSALFRWVIGCSGSASCGGRGQ